jgi:cell division protein FtsB
MIKRILAFTWKILKNYYILATVLFVVWVGFFDNDNILSQFQARKELNALLQQKKYYTDEIQKNKDLVRSLSTDSKALERFGREKYLMKKDNEDIYLIITDTVKGE